MNRNMATALLCTLCLLLAAFSWMRCRAVERDASAPRLRARAEGDDIIAKSQEEARTIVAKARDEAAWYFANARRSADKILAEGKSLMDTATQREQAVRAAHLMHEQQLEQIYPGLRRFTEGENEVNQDYFKGFTYGDRNVALILEASDTVRPNITVEFFNSSGFVTGEIEESWLLDTIARGERRIIEKPVNWRFGTPTYFWARVHSR